MDHEKLRTQELAARIRSSRGILPQEYVAIRIGRSKGWLSKVENAMLVPDPAMVKKLGSLLGWNSQEIEEAFALLGLQDSKRKKRHQLMRTIKFQLEELQKLTSDGMAMALYHTYVEMSPEPTFPFLLFISDTLRQAISKVHTEQSAKEV